MLLACILDTRLLATAWAAAIFHFLFFFFFLNLVNFGSFRFFMVTLPPLPTFTPTPTINHLLLHCSSNGFSTDTYTHKRHTSYTITYHTPFS